MGQLLTSANLGAHYRHPNSPLGFCKRRNEANETIERAMKCGDSRLLFPV